MLYNALHIGDQLLSIAGILVQNATDAQRLIKGAPSLYVSEIRIQVESSNPNSSNPNPGNLKMDKYSLKLLVSTVS